MEDLVKRPVPQDVLTFYRGKRVLLTGDTGFKGSWLGLWLTELGAQVQGVALPAKKNDDHYVSANLAKTFSHINLDIRELTPLKKIFTEFKPEIVFHLAAQSLVYSSYEDPKETFDVNLGGSTNVLECVRMTESVKSLIYVTSDKSYRNREWIWGYRETDELGGHDPYSASKAAAEFIFSSYLDSYFRMRNLGASSVRAGNVIGGGDFCDNRIIPDCIRSLQEGQPIFVRNPSAVRPWQHVLEPIWGYMLLAYNQYCEPKRFSGAWNFGPERSSCVDVKKLVGEVLKEWGSGSVNFGDNPIHETSFLSVNWEKALRFLNWRPQFDFATTVQRTVNWYSKVHNKGDAAAISRSQIAEYTQRLTRDAV